MSLWLSADDIDTPEIAALVAEHKALEDQAETIRHRQHWLREEADRLRLALRPTFPTDEMRVGIAEAARRIAAGTKASSHHGDPCAPGDGPEACIVVCEPSGVFRDGGPSYVHVDPRPPTSLSGAPLWSFSDEEEQALAVAFAEVGLTIVESWRGGQGLSYRVNIRKPARVS